MRELRGDVRRACCYCFNTTKRVLYEHHSPRTPAPTHCRRPTPARTRGALRASAVLSQGALRVERSEERLLLFVAPSGVASSKIIDTGSSPRAVAHRTASAARDATAPATRSGRRAPRRSSAAVRAGRRSRACSAARILRFTTTIAARREGSGRGHLNRAYFGVAPNWSLRQDGRAFIAEPPRLRGRYASERRSSGGAAARRRDREWAHLRDVSRSSPPIRTSIDRVSAAVEWEGPELHPEYTAAPTRSIEVLRPARRRRAARVAIQPFFDGRAVAPAAQRRFKASHWSQACRSRGSRSSTAGGDRPPRARCTAERRRWGWCPRDERLS